MIGLAVGPTMNLLWGIRARHYAISILAAFAGGAGSVRQILLHIQPDDPGYGPEFWDCTFTRGPCHLRPGCRWVRAAAHVQTPLDAGDTGVMASAAGCGP